MALISVDRTKYVRGERGLRTEDPVAVNLDGLTLDQVYAVGGMFIVGTDEGELRAKYAANNPGQQRMHVGNRLRKYARKEDFPLQAFETLCSEYRDANHAANAEAHAAAEAAKAQKAAAKEAAKAEKEAAKAEKAEAKAAAVEEPAPAKEKKSKSKAA